MQIRSSSIKANPRTKDDETITQMLPIVLPLKKKKTKHLITVKKPFI